MNRLLVVITVLAGCSKSTPPPTKWLELTPMPIKLQVPANATAAQNQESTDRTAPPGMIISARECVVVVTPGSRGDLAKQEAAVTTEHAAVKVTRRDAPSPDGSGLFLAYEYPGPRSTLHSFRSEWTIGETTYRCEPFGGRPTLTCEEPACRSLKAIEAPTARGGP